MKGSQRAPLFLFLSGLHTGCILLTHLPAELFCLLHADCISKGLGAFLPRELNPLTDNWWCGLRAHAVVCVISDESRLFPSCMMPGVIASDDALHLPPFQFIVELMSRDTDFAHEQLKELVDGGQFFGFASPSSVGFSSSFSTSGFLKNVSASFMTT